MTAGLVRTRKSQLARVPIGKLFRWEKFLVAYRSRFFFLSVYNRRVKRKVKAHTDWRDTGCAHMLGEEEGSKDGKLCTFRFASFRARIVCFWYGPLAIALQLFGSEPIDDDPVYTGSRTGIWQERWSHEASSGWVWESAQCAKILSPSLSLAMTVTAETCTYLDWETVEIHP